MAYAHTRAPGLALWGLGKEGGACSEPEGTELKTELHGLPDS